MNEIIQLLNQYGYIILFLSLMLELILIPIPNEALMSYVGVLCFQGKMNLILSILVAGIGGITGATISYWIGYKLGAPFFRKFGHYVHLGPEKMDRLSKWYEKYGKALLIVSFFIPGVRHIASIITGIIKLPFRAFAIFAYIGVFLWTGTFIFLGNLLGPQWDQYQDEIKKWLVFSSIVIAIMVLLYFAVRTNREFIKESFVLLYQHALKRFRSFWKMNVLILIIFILFVLLLTFMIGMIQDFVSNEFTQFNAISKTIIFSLLQGHFKSLMHAIFALSSWKALGICSAATIAIIVLNRRKVWMELIFFGLTWLGSFLIGRGFNWLFQFMMSGMHVSDDFPNRSSMLFISIYGFLMMMLIRHRKNYLLSAMLFFFFLFVLLVYFVSGVYVHHLQPSDMAAGFVFGAVWLTLTLLGLEMLRLLSFIKKDIEKDPS